MNGYPSGDHLYCVCPLHKDHAPSFSLNIGNGLWFCHAEQRGGSFAQLTMEILGCSIGDAERWIVERSYIVKPLEKQPEQVDAQAVGRKLAQEYAQATDAELPLYWFERGFDWIDAERWGVRYNAATRRIVLPHRFPIGGPIVGLSGRTVVGAIPKYLHSADFPKRTTLYGYRTDIAADAILLVEGQLDAIRASKFGYVAFATFGAFVTDYQARLLRRLSARYIVAMDLDSAGTDSTRRLERTLLEAGIDYRLFDYPSGRKDLGECTADDIQKGIATARTFAARQSA